MLVAVAADAVGVRNCSSHVVPAHSSVRFRASHQRAASTGGQRSDVGELIAPEALFGQERIQRLRK
jgi:hypothetical protein